MLLDELSACLCPVAESAVCVLLCPAPSLDSLLTQSVSGRRRLRDVPAHGHQLPQHQLPHHQHQHQPSTGSTEKYKKKSRKILIFETSSLFSHVANRDIIKWDFVLSNSLITRSISHHSSGLKENANDRTKNLIRILLHPLNTYLIWACFFSED